jgi:hypothetical protein
VPIRSLSALAHLLNSLAHFCNHLYACTRARTHTHTYTHTHSPPSPESKRAAMMKNIAIFYDRIKARPPLGLAPQARAHGQTRAGRESPSPAQQRCRNAVETLYRGCRNACVSFVAWRCGRLLSAGVQAPAVSEDSQLAASAVRERVGVSTPAQTAQAPFVHAAPAGAAAQTQHAGRAGLCAGRAVPLVGQSESSPQRVPRRPRCDGAPFPCELAPTLSSAARAS